MEGDRRITLLRPGASHRTSSGDLVQGEPIAKTYYAVKRERAGSEGTLADTSIGEWQARFEVRWQASTKDITPEWRLVTDNGREYDIESVVEAPIGRRQWIWIYAVARTVLAA